MRLSEAIRLGALISSQAVGAFVREKEACALGAAMVATGSTATFTLTVWDRWRWAWAMTALCPVCKTSSTSVLMLIIHLNDDHRWPREEIGRWVATVEPKDTVSARAAASPDEDPQGMAESFR